MQTCLKPQSKRGGKSTIINQMFQLASESQEQAIDLDILKRINFDEIEKLDPNVQDGYLLYYTSLVTTEIELEEKVHEGYDQTLSQLVFKIYVKDDDMTPKNTRNEICTEDDVEFYYTTDTITEIEFQGIERAISRS